MRSALLALALLTAAPAFAADAPAPASIKTGAMLRDATDRRLGNISRVNADGSVSLILDFKFVTIPANTLSVVDGKVTTKLSKHDIDAMN